MKTFEGGVKYRLIRQNEKFPVDIVGYNVMAVNTDLKKIIILTSNSMTDFLTLLRL
jgi:hypothetical protein